MQEFDTFQSTGVREFTADEIAQAVASIQTVDDVKRLAAEAREHFYTVWGYDPDAEVEDEYDGPTKRKIPSPS